MELDLTGKEDCDVEKKTRRNYKSAKKEYDDENP
jgi:hypothetical protein